jgi:hypothetical protein
LEADLARFYHCDLRDLYRFDADGVRRLTLRMVLVRVKHLPADSALGGGWTRSEHLLDELRRQVAGSAGVKNPKPHPDRPKRKPRRMTKQRKAKLDDARRRARERRKAIAEGRL